jgi:hypothetical protein
MRPIIKGDSFNAVAIAIKCSTSFSDEIAKRATPTIKKLTPKVASKAKTQPTKNNGIEAIMETISLLSLNILVTFVGKVDSLSKEYLLALILLASFYNSRQI